MNRSFSWNAVREKAAEKKKAKAAKLSASRPDVIKTDPAIYEREVDTLFATVTAFPPPQNAQPQTNCGSKIP